jgi:hypothetical protein
MTGSKMGMSQLSVLRAEAKAMHVGFVYDKVEEKVVINIENTELL